MNIARNEGEYQVGPGMASMIMILVALCMATLAILAYASARADERLGQRSLAAVEAYYAADAAMQRALFEVDAELHAAREQAAGDADAYAQRVLAMQGGAVRAVEEAEDDMLRIELVVPIADQRHLAATLLTPRGLYGPRFRVSGYQTVDETHWEADEGFSLFGAEDEELWNGPGLEADGSEMPDMGTLDGELLD